MILGKWNPVLKENDPFYTEDDVFYDKVNDFIMQQNHPIPPQPITQDRVNEIFAEIEEIRAIWEANPNLRFGQLIYNRARR